MMEVERLIAQETMEVRGVTALTITICAGNGFRLAGTHAIISMEDNMVREASQQLEGMEDGGDRALTKGLRQESMGGRAQQYTTFRLVTLVREEQAAWCGIKDRGSPSCTMLTTL